MLVALRREADVLLVGRRTVELEGYRRPTAARRPDASPRAGPRLAIVSARGQLDFDAATFSSSAGDDDPAPLVFCETRHVAAARAAADGRAEVVGVDACAADRTASSSGNPGVELSSVLRTLNASGASVVLCEGGPTLNGHLFATRAVDEVNLTVASVVVAGDAGGIVSSDEPIDLTTFALAQVAQARDLLFLRYVRREKTPK